MAPTPLPDALHKGIYTLPPRLGSQYPSPFSASFPVESETEKVEGSWPFLDLILWIRPAERDQSGLFRVELQPELTQAL